MDMKKIRVAVITPGILPVPAVKGGAVEVLTTYLLKGFEESGTFDVDVYSSADHVLNEVKYRNIHIIQVLPCNISCFQGKWARRIQKYLKIGMGYHAYQYELKKMYQSGKYDIVLFENCMKNICILKYKKKKEKWFYHMHNDIEERFHDKEPRNLKIVQSKCDLIMACSNYIKNSCLTYFPYAKIETFYNAIDLDIFHRDKYKNRDFVRSKMGIESDDFVFLFSGRIVEEKGVDKLISALKKIEEKSRVIIVIAGRLASSFPSEQAYIDKIIERAKEPEILHHIIFTGYIDYDSIPELYSAVDCIIFPSQVEEAFGMAVVEAMAMGKPVIATKTGGVTEIIDKETGILIEKGNQCIEQLKDAMKWMINHKEYAYRMGEKGYEKVNRKKEWSQINYFKNFLEIIKRNSEFEGII